LFFFGEYRTSAGYPSAILVEEAMDGFLGADELENWTDRVEVNGSDDVEVYVFAKKESPGHFVATVLSEDYTWNRVETGVTEMVSIRVPIPSGFPEEKPFRVVIKRLDRNSFETIAREEVFVRDGWLDLYIEESLDQSEFEELVVFATVEDGDFGPSMRDQRTDPEPNRLIEDGEIISFHYGNWVWSRFEGGLDEGMQGDGHALSFSKFDSNRNHYPVILRNDYEEGSLVEMTFELEFGEGEQAENIQIFWDGVLILEGPEESIESGLYLVSEPLNLTQGPHELTFALRDPKVHHYFPALKAMRIRRVDGMEGAEPPKSHYERASWLGETGRNAVVNEFTE
ncbi:MAG: hypothetical protein ACQKBT_08350, partial [Puniceicoccales bacterium]